MASCCSEIAWRYLKLCKNKAKASKLSNKQHMAKLVRRHIEQNRPSVITCAPASNRNCNLSHCHMNGCSPSPPADQTKTNANTVCDPVIEEHFRRSLGKNYKEAEPVSNSVSITGSVDDHFAKALGDAWLQIKAKDGGHQTPEADP